MAAACSEMGAGKPLFMTIYATVLAGIIFSSLFVLSSLQSGKPINFAGPWLASSTPTRAFPPPPPLSTPDVDSGRGTAADVDRTSTNGGDTAFRPPPPILPARRPRSGRDDVWTREIWDAPSPGSKMPPPYKFRLTKDLVRHRVKHNVIIVTFGNYAFMDFILNWVRHLTDLNLSNLLVGAMDTKLLEALYWKGVPVFDMGSNMNTTDVGWGTPTFHKMGREKVILINAFLPFGYELLMCDTDMVWIKNPLPYLARFPDADVLTSSDQVVPTVTDDKLEVWQEVSGAFNIGIFHWRPTKVSMKLAKEWLELLLTDEKIWDQNGFNELVRKHEGSSGDDNGLLYAYDGNLKLGILPASIFCSGHTYFVQEMPQQLKLEAYAVHTTFQYAGTEGKRHRLREARLFYDPPEYYDPPGGLLSYKPSIPKNLLFGGEHTVESHFALVNYQIKQVRTALAIASLLNRTLVMPALWCRLDRLWYGHPGVLPGTITRQPFVCPMDHIFEVHVMLKKGYEEVFGPNIDFREYSFFKNKLLPAKVKESWLEIQPCDEHSASCHEKKPGVLRLLKNSTEETLKEILLNYKDVKVLQFSSIDGVFRGFSSKEKEEKFRRRVKRYTGIWCCVENRQIGHIYYDIYWDEKPGWTPAPPEKREDDHPPW